MFSRAIRSFLPKYCLLIIIMFNEFYRDWSNKLSTVMKCLKRSYSYKILFNVTILVTYDNWDHVTFSIFLI